MKTLHPKHSFSRPQLGLFILVFGLIGYLIFRALAAPNPNLPGDLNGDNTVNIQDLSIMLSNYGTANSTADINSDGTVNVLDMSILLSHYGQVYNPGPSGTIIEQVNYNNPSPFGWNYGIQAYNYGLNNSLHPPGSYFQAETDPAGGSRKVLHVHLPAYTNGRAAEGLYKRSIDLGVTDYFGLSLYLPVGWHNIPQNAGWHTLAAQLNYGADDGPAVGLVVQPNDLEINILAGHVSVNPTTGDASGYEFQAGPNSSNRLYLTQNLTSLEGQWINIIIGVKWASSWNGFVNAWIKSPGGSWSQTVDSQNSFGKLVPTMQWEDTAADGQLVDINGIDKYTGLPKITVDKAGLYAGPGTTPVDIYESTFLRGTSFNVVANQLP